MVLVHIYLPPHPLSIVDRYLVREALLAMVAVFLVLFVVLAANRTIEYLTEAAGGELPSAAVATLMGLQILRYLGVVIPAALFLGLVLAMGRLYRDSELPVLAACGLGPARIARGLLYLAVPVALLVALLSLFVAPWASYTSDVYIEEAARTADIGALREGRFIGGGQGTIYAGGATKGGQLQEIFVHVRYADREAIVRAARGEQLFDPESGQRYFIFSDGYRYDGRPGELDWSVTRFERHGLLVDTYEPVEVRRDREGTPSIELWERGSARDWAELHWRASMPLMVVVLTLLAVPLAKAEPRDGRYGKLLSAVLVFVVYFQLLSTGREWIEQGDIPGELGLLWVHALGVMVAVVWTWRRFGRRWRLWPGGTGVGAVGGQQPAAAQSAQSGPRTEDSGPDRRES
ncbi:LPS export ABC transporter permease LptF [Halorhodospira abdelmalekii]|uniref:LPS export ABC transporter permease LptF n=1 Tax=Halorhodospira abdelmalekii TaxID=421629 RepID=UPI001906DA64|nr:LPS export ABC transporter permease LptF [Halorhodospira abdelmalekii]MBK1734802.1 LPS export ABC transporter permease LptF [Halorhodospira abdelmalekii]